MEVDELGRQYTPSLWSTRLPQRVIVDHYVEVLTEGEFNFRREEFFFVRSIPLQPLQPLQPMQSLGQNTSTFLKSRVSFS